MRAVIVCVIALVTLCAAASRDKRYDEFPGYVPTFADPFAWVPMFVPEKPWYEGDNVCMEKKESNAPEFLKEWWNDETFAPTNFQQQSQHCRGSNSKYVCLSREMTNEGIKTIATKYECCHGFVRPSDGSPGCVEIDLRDLLPTLRNIRATKMADIAERVGFTDALYVNNYTVFAPLNSALEAFETKFVDNVHNDILSKRRQRRLRAKMKLHRLISTHLVSGFVKVNDIPDGHVLQSEEPSGSIRINTYYTPERVVTANCVQILSADHFARNGIVHVTEKLIPNPTKTVADIITGDAQFSVLKKILSKAGWVQSLRSPNGTYTLFAPTDSVSTRAMFKKLSAKGHKCFQSLMKHHIINHSICSSALPHHVRISNLAGELLTLNRDRDNKLYVDGVQVVVRDWVATNGVVHVIDGLLTTRQAKCVSQVLEDSGLSEFLKMLKKAKFKSKFDSMENVTFFIPTDEAVREASSRSILNRNDSIEDILMHHVVGGSVELRAPNQVFPSKLPNATLRIQVLSVFPHVSPQVLVQCASMLSPDNKLCGGTLHVINKVLIPIRSSIMELLERTEGFSTLVLLLKATGLERRFENQEVPQTLIAPTDDAFQQLGEDHLFRLIDDLSAAMDLVRMHILPGVLCCSQLKSSFLAGRQQVRAIDGSLMRIERSRRGSLLVGEAHIVDCDVTATNGVIHVVNAVLKHDSMLRGNELMIRI